MSTHIGAAPGDIAPVVLMPGDPLRAKWIAETFLDDARCYTEVRGMLGFTGTWQRPAGLGPGLGDGSAVAGDLRQRALHRVRRAVGRPGRLVRRPDRPAGAARHRDRLRRLHRLLDEPDHLRGPRLRARRRLRPAARPRSRRRSTRGTDVHVGLLFSSDSFYPSRPELIGGWSSYGVLAVEMEASALYTLAAKHGRRALAICTVSDHIVTGEETTAAEREQTFGEMVEIALEAALGDSERTSGDQRASARPRATGRGRCRVGASAVAGRRCDADVVERRAHPLERHAGELGPGDAGRAPAGAGRRSRRGWSSSRRPASRAVAGSRVDRVDPAADHLAGEHQRERRLDAVRAPVAERTVPRTSRSARARSASSSMPASARPGSSSGSKRSCWPKRASTQAWKRVPKPRRRRRRARHRPGQLAGERVGVVAQPGQRRSPTGWPGSGTSTTGDCGRAAPRRAAARARRPTRRPGAASTMSSSASSAPAGRAARDHARRPRAAQRRLAPVLGRPARRSRRVDGGVAGWGRPSSGLSQPRRPAPRPTHSSWSRTTRWYGGGAERRLRGRPPEVRR